MFILKSNRRTLYFHMIHVHAASRSSPVWQQITQQIALDYFKENLYFFHL